MNRKARTSVARGMARRRCVACGCADRALRRPVERRPMRCPSCGEDLYARPPRSYAEMEGLTALPVVRLVRWDLALFFERSIAIGMGVVVTLGFFASAMR